MKIKSTITGALYEFEPSAKGNEERQVCPECSQFRKKKTDKCFAWNNASNVGHCHNCEASFYVYNPVENPEYVVPEWKNITALTDKAVKWFTSRMISQSTLNKMKVYSDTVFMPQLKADTDTICMPYFFQGRVLNIKYRGPQKSFKLYSGAELIFYNQDALLNFDGIIIVEGEMDALSFIQCGYDNVVSVPNGANLKLEYLDSYHSLFDNKVKIYLGTDQDTKGIELRDELSRRLGPERCLIVNYKDCKDANEYLMKYGGVEFNKLIDDAKPVPVKGVITPEYISVEINSLFQNDTKPGLIIDEPFDKYIKWETGRLAIVTGIPSSGKSEFVDYITVKLNLKHGWKCAYFTPENYPLKYHYAKIYEKLIGKKFHHTASSTMEYDMAFDHIKDNFFYILNEDDFTVETMFTAAKSLIKTRGIKVFVADPYNRLDHQYSDSETQYISRFLDKLTNFARFNDVLVFLVAHPRKMDRDAAGKIRVPTLYDISGSANFFNKADYGFTVHRKTNSDNTLRNEVEIHWQKIKFKYLGEPGVSELNYNYINGRFQATTAWENSNWLSKTVEQKILSYDNWQKDDKESPF